MFGKKPELKKEELSHDSSKIDVSEKLEQGYIHIRAIIEMLGTPKEHLLETLKSYVKKLSEDEKFIILNEDYSEPEEKETMFAVFVELDILIKGIENVSWFAFDYMPSSLEIVEPEQFKYRSNEMTSFLNDLLGRLHQLDMVFKTSNAKIAKLNANSEALLKNLIGNLIESSPKTLSEICKKTGISEKELELVLNKFIGDKYVHKSNDGKYSLSESVSKRD